MAGCAKISMNWFTGSLQGPLLPGLPIQGRSKCKRNSTINTIELMTDPKTQLSHDYRL